MRKNLFIPLLLFSFGCSTGEMIDRIKAAVDAKTDEDFVVMARTDALANEGLYPAIERAIAYQEAGADAV